MKLYEISDRIEYILSECVEEDGTMTQQTAEMLDQLEEMEKDKAIACLKYMHGEELEAEAMLKVARNIQQKAAKHMERAEWLKSYVAAHLGEDVKLKDPALRTHWRSSQSVAVSDQPSVPTTYLRVKVITEIDKEKAKKALKKGENIPGLFLEEKTHLIVKFTGSDAARGERDE